jgi:hypothetical protein
MQEISDEVFRGEYFKDAGSDENAKDCCSVTRVLDNFREAHSRSVIGCGSISASELLGQPFNRSLFGLDSRFLLRIRLPK